MKIEESSQESKDLQEFKLDQLQINSKRTESDINVINSNKIIYKPITQK